MARWSRRRLALAVSSGLLLALALVLFVVLPPVVRRVAVDRLARLTGRPVALGAVELNVFTGRVGLVRFRLGQRDSAEPAVQFERLDVRVSPLSLVTRNIHVVELTLTQPRIFVTRLAPDRYDFSDLLALGGPSGETKPAKPSSRTITLERLRVVDGAVVAHDLVPAPAAEWRIEGLEVTAGGLGTRRGGPPGRLVLQARINGTPLAVDATAVDLAGGRVAARVSLDGFDLAAARAYLPPELPAAPAVGRVTLDLSVTAERAADGTPRVALAGDVGLDGLTVVQRARPDPFVTIGRVAVKIKEALPLAREVTLAAVEIDGLDLKTRRDPAGRIDLLELTAPPAGPATTPAPAAAAPVAASPAPSLRVAIERLALRRTRVTVTDEGVRPAITLALSDVTATLEHVTWPGAAPLAFDVALALPTAGRLTAKGTATLSPVTVDVAMSLRNGSIEPYAPYIPMRARLAGRFNGDSRSQISLAGGRLTATSQGRSWVEDLEVRPPDGGTPPLRIARLEMAGIDFGWPTHAGVATITVTRPEAQLERDAAGAITLRELLTAPPDEAAKPAPAPPLAATTPAPKTTLTGDPRGGAVGFPLDIGAFVIEDGYVRFLDRTVQPAFSETLSRLALRIEGLSSTPGKRARLTGQAIVGGDAALELHGELAPLGELYADISGELRDFTLTGVNPYAESTISWLIDRGKLGIRFHFHVERDQIDATNEVVVENLHVAPSARENDEVKKRIGLPLGLIVALITDSDNGIKISLPVSGPLAGWRADFGDAIWTVVRNVLVNVMAAPFRAIGRLFKGSDDRIESVGVDPVTFAPGSDVVSPAMARHLTAVADFLRRAPAVRLTLATLAGPADLDSLRGQELTARLQKRQRERGLPDFAAAVAAEFAERFPGEAPPAPDAQLARLRPREPVPAAALAALLGHRLAFVREALVKTEGVPETRLAVDEAAAPAAASGEGRVEFRIGQ